MEEQYQYSTRERVREYADRRLADSLTPRIRHAESRLFSKRDREKTGEDSKWDMGWKKKEKRGGVANRNSFHYLRKYNDRLDSILKRVVRVVATNTHAHTKSSQQKKATERNRSKERRK